MERNIYNHELLSPISPDELREMAQMSKDIPFFDKKTGLGLYHPRLSRPYYSIDDKYHVHRTKSFGKEIEALPIQLLSGVGVLNNLWRSTESDDQGLVYLGIKMDKIELLLAICVEKRYITQEHISFGWQVEEDGSEHWEYKNMDTWLPTAVAFDINKMQRKKSDFGYSYMSFSQTVGRALNKDAFDLMNLLQSNKGSTVGYSYNPESDHHFCDWDPSDLGSKYYSAGTMVHGINFVEALWLSS